MSCPCWYVSPLETHGTMEEAHVTYMSIMEDGIPPVLLALTHNTQLLQEGLVGLALAK